MSPPGRTKQKSTCVVVPPNAMPRLSSSGPSVNSSSSGCIVIRGARWVCGSTPPGTTTIPAASRVRAASVKVPGGVTATMRSPCTATSQAPAPCGVTTRPFLTSRSSMAILRSSRLGGVAAATARFGGEGGGAGGEGGAGALVLVLEEDERVTPAGPDAPHGGQPAAQVVVGVAGRAEPTADPVGGGDGRGGAVVVVGDAQRGVAAGQTRVDLVAEPARVAELEGGPHVGRQQR